jgi:hypothetical protein
MGFLALFVDSSMCILELNLGLVSHI